jgi:lipopolysaccharide/colanic/teichoic acid biosynthesis glycosyltransferase
LKAQPGLTGLQQVKARSTADFDQQVLLDINYIDQQSLWLDITIILLTPFVVLSTRGAE